MPYANPEDQRAAFRRWYAKNRAKVCAKKRAKYWADPLAEKRRRVRKYLAQQLHRRGPW